MQRKLATLVIAEHNEGIQLNESLDNLLEHNDPNTFNIIVVSDGSEIPLDIDKYGRVVKHIQKPVREGVGAAFDTGAEHVTTPHMFIMGSDIRFREAGMVAKMVDYLEDDRNGQSLICTTNLGINQAAGKTIQSEGLLKRYGARTLLFMAAEDLPPKGSVMGRLKHDKAVSNYRNILESKWISKQEGSLYPIPCVLGAFYGVRISWYRYIDGFRGHRYWGTLEPFISMKSWLAGGWCKIATDIETGHLFKKSGSHYTRGSDLLYNKMAIAKILFSKSISDFMIRYLGDNQDVRVAKELIKFDKEKIDELHDRFQAVKHRDIHWYNERFPLKYYELIKGYTDETRHTF